MATPEANLTASRTAGDVNGNHAVHPQSARNIHNFNTFQFVSQLVSATPPYLFNMSAPFPGNFFSDLLRRMAPRAGTPGMPPDASLQQHIRAALLAKGTPPPTLSQSVVPSPLDLAALAAQQRLQQQSLPPTSSHDKGLKRSLFSDISALSSCEDENGIKRARLEEARDERRDLPPESLTSPFLMQPPFLPTAVPPHDVMSPWTARASLMRPQISIPSHVAPAPLDPYRLLLDLRLAGQLRSMAASQALHHKDTPSIGHPLLITPLSSANRLSPLREARHLKDEPPASIAISQPNTLRGDDSRISAFHPPGRSVEVQPDTSDEEGKDRRCHSRNSSNSSSSSSSNKDVMRPQYIFKHLTDIYRSIHVQRNGSAGIASSDDSKSNGCLPPGEIVRPSSELAKPLTSESLQNSSENSRKHETESANGSSDNHNKTATYKQDSSLSRDFFASANGHIEGRRSPSANDDHKLDGDKESGQSD